MSYSKNDICFAFQAFPLGLPSLKTTATNSVLIIAPNLFWEST